MDELTLPKRPRGLVPGSVDWLREIEGPRLLKRLVDEVHAGTVGTMSPTQARCAAMLMDRIHPTVSAVHHTVQTGYSKMSDDELRQKLAELVSQETAQRFDNLQVTDVEAVEVPNDNADDQV